MPGIQETYYKTMILILVFGFQAGGGGGGGEGVGGGGHRIDGKQMFPVVVICHQIGISKHFSNILNPLTCIAP